MRGVRAADSGGLQPPSGLHRIALRSGDFRIAPPQRGGVDHDTLGMTYRVMQHTHFRARQVRDSTVQKASSLLIEYVDAMGGHEHCEPEVLDVHFCAINRLLAYDPSDASEAANVAGQLEAVVRQRIARRRAA